MGHEQAHPDYNADMDDLRVAVKAAEKKAADWQAVADKQRAQIEALRAEALDRVRTIGTLSGELAALRAVLAGLRTDSAEGGTELGRLGWEV